MEGEITLTHPLFAGRVVESPIIVSKDGFPGLEAEAIPSESKAPFRPMVSVLEPLKASKTAPRAFFEAPPPRPDPLTVIVGSKPLPGEDAYGPPLAGAAPVLGSSAIGSSLKVGGGGIEAAIRKAVEAQAARWGQTVENWLALIRQASRPEDTVALSAFSGPDAPFALASQVMPLFAKAWARTPEGARLAPRCLAAMAGFRAGEGQWWDRLFKRFRDKTGNDLEALEALVLHLERKPARSLEHVEFGGEFKPLRFLENIPLEKAKERLFSHVKEDWGKGLKGRKLPGDFEVERFVSDLVHEAALFRVPRTLLVALLHDDFKTRGSWPDTMGLRARVGWFAMEIRKSLVRWDPEKPPFCDMDLLAMRILGPSRDFNGFKKAYNSILAHFDIRMAKDSKLFFAS
jgi:hypothetical protein